MNKYPKWKTEKTRFYLAFFFFADWQYLQPNGINLHWRTKTAKKINNWQIKKKGKNSCWFLTKFVCYTYILIYIDFSVSFFFMLFCSSSSITPSPQLGQVNICFVRYKGKWSGWQWDKHVRCVTLIFRWGESRLALKLSFDKLPPKGSVILSILTWHLDFRLLPHRRHVAPPLSLL